MFCEEELGFGFAADCVQETGVVNATVDMVCGEDELDFRRVEWCGV